MNMWVLLNLVVYFFRICWNAFPLAVYIVLLGFTELKYLILNPLLQNLEFVPIHS